MSVTVTIRDVPDQVRDTLAGEARQRGQSLQSYLLSLLEREARFAGNRRLIVEIRREALHAPGVTSDVDVAGVIRSERAARDRGVVSAVTDSASATDKRP